MLPHLALAIALASSTFTKAVPTWAHEESHPAHKLFRRAESTNQVGSPAWSAAYPNTTPDVSKTPQAWTDALNAAIQAGKIPNIPPSTGNNGIITYPAGYDPTSTQVCSSYSKCRIDGDMWDAPDNNIGIGFDDGPVSYDGDPSHTLYDFLKKNNQKATHFMIGLAILQSPKEFVEAFEMGGDIAVHTYTHPYLTTQTNEQLVAQFGWTMQIIYDSTGGYLPKFWRPPFGDMDVRVRAIAKEVFHLSPILWNQDTGDWGISTGATTPDAVAANLQKWITGPKSPGLVILEHELTNITVSAFINAYPLMVQNKWELPSVARIAKSILDEQVGDVYWNAPNDNNADAQSSTFAAAKPTGSSISSDSSQPTKASTQPSQSSDADTTSSPTPSPHNNTADGGAASISSLPTQALLFALFLSLLTNL